MVPFRSLASGKQYGGSPPARHPADVQHRTRVVQLLLGHTKLKSTVRYLGIEVDDALAIAE
jgi:hypothetical protein